MNLNDFLNIIGGDVLVSKEQRWQIIQQLHGVINNKVPALQNLVVI